MCCHDTAVTMEVFEREVMKLRLSMVYELSTCHASNTYSGTLTAPTSTTLHKFTTLFSLGISS